MSMIGQVHVKKGQYKIKGDFHHLELGQPIRLADEDWRLIGITNPRQLTHMHSYGGEAPFFENSEQGKADGDRAATTRNARPTGPFTSPSGSIARIAWARTRSST